MPNCRERWRNIRGAFLRSTKKPPTGAIEKKKYYLNQYLEFLLPHIKRRISDENLEMIIDCKLEVDDSDFEDDAENQAQSMESPPDYSNQLSRILSSPFNMTDENTQESDVDKSVAIANELQPSIKGRLSQTISTISNTADDGIIKWLNKKERDKRSDNPNMLFLLSLLPDISKMTDKQNRRFRQKVIGLIDDILEDSDVCTETSSKISASS